MLGQRPKRPSNDNDYRDSQAMSSIGGVLQDNFISGSMRGSLSRRTRNYARKSNKSCSMEGFSSSWRLKMRGGKRKMMEENRHQGKTYSLYIYQIILECLVEQL